MLTVGDKFPEFNAQACVSVEEGKEFGQISNNTYEGKWVVYFFYPKDFTFVCPTEIVEFDNAGDDFADRDAVVVGGSTDNEFSHLAWRKSHDDLNKISIPLIAGLKLATDLDILTRGDEAISLRATFIVDPHGVIQWASVNSLSVGRNVEEVIRVLDGIQTDELCPCNWKKGEDTL